MRKTEIGDRVNVRLPRQKESTPAVVLETAPSYEGDYRQCRLKIAQYSPLSEKWLVSVYPKPVQSYKLRNRKEEIPGLDNLEER